MRLYTNGLISSSISRERKTPGEKDQLIFFISLIFLMPDSTTEVEKIQKLFVPTLGVFKPVLKLLCQVKLVRNKVHKWNYIQTGWSLAPTQEEEKHRVKKINWGEIVARFKTDFCLLCQKIYFCKNAFSYLADIYVCD